MNVLVFILLVALSGFVVGALARLAVPGRIRCPSGARSPSASSARSLGGLIAGLLGVGGSGGIFLLAFAGAVVLLIAYRRVFQGRGITGPGARRR